MTESVPANDPGTVASPPPVAPAPAPPAPTAPAAATHTAPEPHDRVRQLEGELAAARQEAAGYRVGNKGQIKELREALGLKEGEELASIPKRIQAMESENRQMKLDGALADVYGKHGVDPRLTRALLVSEGIHGSLNPSDPDFSKTINASVKKLAEDFPAIKLAAPASPIAPRSGPDLPPGGAGAPPQLSREDLARMSSKEVADAYAKGQLNGLLKRS